MEMQINPQKSWTVVGGIVIFVASIAQLPEFQSFLKVLPIWLLPAVTGFVSIIVMAKRIFWPTGCNLPIDAIPDQPVFKVEDSKISNEIPPGVTP